MAPMTKSKTCAQIVYFETEGRKNLDEVVRILKRLFRKREELRNYKIVIFTAFGEGPVLAFNKLKEFNPKVVAVTFPRTFSIQRNNEPLYPRISEPVLNFFKENKVTVVVPPSLPFDLIDGMDGHNQQVQIISKTIAMFGSGFALCVQAVLRACDVGVIEEGETVIAMSGDVAALVIASTTKHFLNAANGLAIEEIFCKPKKLTVSRPMPEAKKLIEGAIDRVEVVKA